MGKVPLLVDYWRVIYEIILNEKKKGLEVKS